jgi:hypothetical protein
VRGISFWKLSARLRIGLVDDELHGYSCRVTTAAACTHTSADLFFRVCVCAVAKRAPCQNSIRGREKSGRGDSYSDDIRLMIPVSDSVLPP